MLRWNVRLYTEACYFSYVPFGRFDNQLERKLRVANLSVCLFVFMCVWLCSSQFVNLDV